MWNETRHSVEQEQKSKVQTGWRRYTRVINPCFLGCLQRASLGRALQVPSAGKETTYSKAMRMLQLHIPSGKLLPKTMERSTMLFSWENPLFRLGHFHPLSSSQTFPLHFWIKSCGWSMYLFIYLHVVFKIPFFESAWNASVTAAVYVPIVTDLNRGKSKHSATSYLHVVFQVPFFESAWNASVTAAVWVPMVTGLNRGKSKHTVTSSPLHCWTKLM